MTSVSAVESTDFDQPRYMGDPRIYVIASQPRSGSHYLAQLLRSTGEAGVPLEYFHAAHWKRWVKRCGKFNPPSAFYMMCQLRTTPNGVFGLKAHWKQFQFACHLRLEPKLKDAAFIQITRADMLGQAISLVMASQTGAWIHGHERQRAPEYSFTAIQSALSQVATERAGWDLFFASTGIEPIRISYEELTGDTDAIMRRVCDHIGIGWSPSEPATARVQRSGESEAWRERFLTTLPELQESGNFWRGQFSGQTI